MNYKQIIFSAIATLIVISTVSCITGNPFRKTLESDFKTRADRLEWYKKVVHKKPEMKDYLKENLSRFINYENYIIEKIKGVSQDKIVETLKKLETTLSKEPVDVNNGAAVDDQNHEYFAAGRLIKFFKGEGAGIKTPAEMPA